LPSRNAPQTRFHLSAEQEQTGENPPSKAPHLSTIDPTATASGTRPLRSRPREVIASSKHLRESQHGAVRQSRRDSPPLQAGQERRPPRTAEASSTLAHCVPRVSREHLDPPRGCRTIFLDVLCIKYRLI